MSSRPSPTLVHHLFEAQVAVRPHAPAVICGERSLSYQDVERQANQLARVLRARGARRGRFVALYLDRSERAIITILGIFKSGAAYVPIDPVYPIERIRHILADADVACVVTEGALADLARAWHPLSDVVALDDPRTVDDLALASSEPLAPTNDDAAPDDLCYVMYTSGTTGRPKGIMTEHRNVIAFTAAFQAVCAITPEDRIYQGFSLGFDGSTEEYVLAFVAGAPLVVGPPALARDGVETRRYLAAQGVTYFSTVPTFLRLLDEDVPSLRLIVVSGEPCPPDLIRRWTKPGRRMLNVYGPTETTVNTTSWDCVADAPVSIGSPIDGYLAYLLDPDGQPVANGPGELFIGGPGVARGYLNQPDLTAAVFRPDPFAGQADARMYRTGDLVESDGTGALRFLGRIDSQVKIRGFRIELEEVESVLREYPGVDAAAASVVERDGQTFLAAHVVAAGGLDRSALGAHLRSRLPPYMVPAFLDAVASLPRLASGKLDRRSLPAPEARLVESSRPIVAARSVDEARLVAMWETLFHTAPVSIEDNFFQDLGGDSLLATSFINALHETVHRSVALRDVYRHPTIAQITPLIFAAAVAEPEAQDTRPTAQAVLAATPAMVRALAVSLQALGAMALYGLASVVPFLLLSVVQSVVSGVTSPARGTVIGVGITAVSYPVWLAVTIALKWILVGRYRPGRHSVYGVGYVRFWLARRVQTMSGAALLAGTPLMSLYYRLMGARVGRRCLIDTPHCAAPDLIAIGDDTAIGAETHLLGYRLERGHLEFGTVTIGRGCFIGTHSALEIETRIEDEGRLGDQSALARGTTLPAGGSWRGSPATAGPVPVPVPTVSTKAGTSRSGVADVVLSAVYAVLVIALELIVLAALAPFAVLAWHLRNSGFLALALIAAVPLSVVALAVMLAVVKTLVLRRLPPGVYPVRSVLFVRKWFADALVMLSRVYLHPLYTTIYLPPWLRLLGARIGRFAEISTIGEGAPDLFDLGDQSFFADGSMIGGRRLYAGHVEVAWSRIGRRSFVGNSAILPVGSHLGDGCLLGVLSTPPETTATVPDGTEWLGSPSFRLPHRRKVEGFAATETYDPTPRLVAHRLVVDAVRVLFPGAVLLTASLVAYQLTVLARADLSMFTAFALLPLAGTALALFVVVAVVLLKVNVMGRFEPVIAPLWSPYVWWNEAVNGAWESIAAPALGPVVGSPLFSVALRWMGCRVGPGSRVHTTLFSEFDLVHVGRGVMLGEGAVAQNHLFEDRIMKSSVVAIGDDASIGNMAIVLYDTEVGDGATVAPLSLVMKGARVPSGASWAGIPACAMLESPRP